MDSSEDYIDKKIPKIIHHTWFGPDPYPPLVRKCISSWKKNLPDYEIITWTPENFDLDICPWVRESYDAKKYAYTSDYVRYYVLYHYGGIYLDADVAVKKGFDPLLNCNGFAPFSDNHQLNGVVLGAVKGLSYFSDVVKSYDKISFPTPGVSEAAFLTSRLLNDGFILNGNFQEINGFRLYPYSFFSWASLSSLGLSLEDTYAIHKPYGSWRDNAIYHLFNRNFSEHFELFNSLSRNILGENLTQKIVSKIKDK